jgi:hypothetical protein
MSINTLWKKHNKIVYSLVYVLKVSGKAEYISQQDCFTNVLKKRIDIVSL